MSCEIFTGMVNFRISATVTNCATGLAMDISTSSAQQFVIIKPSGENDTVGATFTTDGTDGKIYYDSVADTFDEPGTYRCQALITYVDGTIYRSDAKTFRVNRSLA